MEIEDETEKIKTEIKVDEKRHRPDPNVCEYCETDFLAIDFEMKEDEDGGVSIVCDIENCGQLCSNFNEYREHHRETCPKKPTEVIQETKSRVRRSSRKKNQTSKSIAETEAIKEMKEIESEKNFDEKGQQELGPNICEYCETDFLEIEFEMKEDGNGGVSIVCDIEDCGQLFPNFNEYKIHHRETCPKRPAEIKKSRAQSSKKKSERSGTRKSLRHRKRRASPDIETDDEEAVEDSIGKSSRRKSTKGPKIRKKSYRKPNGLNLKCETCGGTFTSRGSLYSHRKIIHELACKQVCDICGMSCRDKSSLSRHKLTHTSSTEWKYQCEECGRQFKHKHQIRNHKRTHTKEKPFLCQTCGKKFRTTDQLRSHIRRIHEEDFHAFCDVCGKGFVDNCTLSRHMVCHNNSKPDEKDYHCRDCDWQGKGRHRFIYHRRIHTQDNPTNACHVCGKEFRLKDSLQKHMVTHSKDVKEFPCDICGKLFASRGYVTSHIWAQHKERGKKQLEPST